MVVSPIDSSIETAVAFAETVAKSYAHKGGDIIDFFAAFAGLVVSEDMAIGLRCLTAADNWIVKARPSSSNDEKPAPSA
jgi:hypothetical protein